MFNAANFTVLMIGIRNIQNAAHNNNTQSMRNIGRMNSMMDVNNIHVNTTSDMQKMNMYRHSQRIGLDNNSHSRRDDMLNNTFYSTSDLRQELGTIADNMLGTQYEQPGYEKKYGLLKSIVQNKLNLGHVVEGKIDYNYARGISKGYTIKEGCLIIDADAEVEKQIEGLIEPVVTILVSRLYNNTQLDGKISVVSNGVTYMICKVLELDKVSGIVDLNQYCEGDLFNSLIHNPMQIELYKQLCEKALRIIAQQLEISKLTLL